jgi:phage shock protein PspC (stress-responsive transcriptional regulator)
MTCTSCHREIADEASYCQFCGRRQGARATLFPKPLRRSQVDRKLAGICGGIARYLDTDPVFIRVAWVILSIVPGTILLGVLAYVVAWIIVPEAEPGSEPVIVGAKRMQRSADNVTVAGVCGGLAEYFTVDVTAVRILWVLLSIFPGFVICGLFAYAAAWFIMPEAMVMRATAPPPTPPPAPSTDAAPVNAE